MQNFKERIKAVIRDQSRIKLQDWFYYWLHEQNFGVRKDHVPRNCYYEFGVGWGATMCEFAKAAIQFCSETDASLDDIRIVGFDSFEGLPPKAESADDHPEWKQGDFAFPAEHTLDLLEKLGFPVDNVTLVRGFFEESLTAERQAELRDNPASIVTVDVDYCSSTRSALHFLAPILKPGTVFYFDDLYSFHLHPEMGQLKAINDFNGKLGYLSPLHEFDYAGRTFIYAPLEWNDTAG